jgi:hypothetical protein
LAIHVSFGPESPPPAIHLKRFQDTRITIEGVLDVFSGLAPKTIRIYIDESPFLNFKLEYVDQRATPRRQLCYTAATKSRRLVSDTYVACDELKKQVSKPSIMPRETTVKYVHRFTGTQESVGVQWLTILAAIFHSSSLKIGILSMQSRFNSLGHRLYDMIGMSILIDYLALIFYCLPKHSRYIQARSR